jgi:acyl carrier protein
LLLALEEECEIEFDMEELDPANLESINAITEYILELR